MFKQLCFFKKRTDMTMDQFIDYYENMHSKLAQRLGAPASLPNAQRYVRRYIIKAEKNPITLEEIHPGYDCLMEIWWNSRTDFEQAMAGLHNSKFLPERIEDELKLFASNSNPVCSVEEHESPMGPNGTTIRWVPVAEGESAPQGTVEKSAQKPDTELFKQVCFFKKRPDLSLEQFKEYYENDHSKLAKRIGAPFLPGAVRYVRRYITVQKNPITLEEINPGYDCVMEIWWDSRQDFDRAMVGVHDPKFLQQRMDDEKRLFATHSNPVVRVVEYDTAMGPGGKKLHWIPVPGS
jgi:hypothetical protein